MTTIETQGETITQAALPREAAPLALVPGDVDGPPLPVSELEAMGIIVPAISIEKLRQAFAYRQRLYAAILDSSDYIYVMTIFENGRNMQRTFDNKDDADKARETYKVNYRAAPKKSGYQKLAVALGVEAEISSHEGLPRDRDARYCTITYVATHKATGRMATGIGTCDSSEKGGKLSAHDIISRADTRAYNRAVQRLTGFGDVSGDEIVDAVDDGRQSESAQLREAEKLPPPRSDEVVAASRAWAEAVLKRTGERFLPTNQQNAASARSLRAKARRGDTVAGNQLGAMGLAWEGPAQDGQAFKTFEVEAAPFGIQDVQRVQRNEKAAAEKEEKEKAAAAAAAVEPAAAVAATQAQERHEPGSDTGSSVDSGSDPLITQGEAKVLSEALLGKFGTRDAARAWMKKTLGVEKSLEVRASQYASTMAAIEKAEVAS